MGSTRTEGIGQRKQTPRTLKSHQEMKYRKFIFMLSLLTILVSPTYYTRGSVNAMPTDQMKLIEQHTSSEDPLNDLPIKEAKVVISGKKTRQTTKCVDDLDYISPQGLPCSSYAIWDCRLFSHIGFNELDMYYLMNKCEKSCDTCGINWTVTPSASPTESPSSTVKPSVTPTDLPSHRPSDRPSNRPSDLPTVRPSFSPTSNPSDRPSHSPTTTPTASPSDLPTVSPTSSPSASPSATPTSRVELIKSVVIELKVEINSALQKVDQLEEMLKYL